MIAQFTRFFLENQKITTIFIVIIALFGTLAYIMLPKQYNPSIVAPAFMIEIPANGYDAIDASQYIAKSLENKVKELQWIDSISSYATNWFVSVMVAFEVGIDQEVAKTRLYDKMYSNYDLRPFWVSEVNIRSIDPEDLPQVSLAFTYSWELDSLRAGKYLRSAVASIREELKHVPWVTVMEILGGYKNHLSILLNPEKIEATGQDILSLTQLLKQSFSYGVIGDMDIPSWKTSVHIDNIFNTKESLENFSLWNQLYLRDVATIQEWPIDIRSYYQYATKEERNDAVFLGIAKLKWTNSVVTVEHVLEKLEDIQKRLPKNIVMHVVQNEGTTAEHATSELMFHLFVSIFIVFVILVIFLGARDALNASFCIPMVLGIVFLVALVFWLDINRITLFALILSLWILVDDSIVMVENNARHLGMMGKTGKTKIEAILDSVREVGMSIVFSTITRIMSFVAMFAVTGMMGDYMKPIPIFASIALFASLFVAFSINPFLAFLFHKKDGGHEWHKENKLLDTYAHFLARYINKEEGSVKKRTRLKIIFWITLGAIILTPILLGIFKARMLPKADRNQIYVWVDAPRNASVETVRTIESLTSDFLLGKTGSLDSSLLLAESTSSAIGDRFLSDFANLFRGGSNRIGENQFTMRVNLVPNGERDMKSEEYVIRVRPLLRNFLLAYYPDLRLRLLEDPPGPPVLATFHMKLQWQEDLTEKELVTFATAMERVVGSLAEKESLVDITNTATTTKREIRVEIDHARLRETGISFSQVMGTLWIYFHTLPLSTLPNTPSLEGTNILLGFDTSMRSKEDILENISFINPNGQRIYLRDIARFTDGFMQSDIYTDERARTFHIYSELGRNSVVYPILHLYSYFGTEEFEKESGYRKVRATPYAIYFEGVNDGKEYRIEWGGEWELTMDTFRDLGLAMIFSLFGIYFLIVAQFGSFMVWGIVMTTFLLSFFGIFPGFSLLYILFGTYFTATAMIGAIALGGIVVGNAIILLDYMNQLIEEGKWLEYAVIEGAKKRFIPVMLTSIAAVAGSLIITSDPVWSGLAWSIVWWLSASAVLTLFFIPIFYYTFLRKYKGDIVAETQLENIQEHIHEVFDENTNKKSQET